MVQTGEGHFQKVYQNGELVATEPFVNQAVASIDLTLYATAADLQNTVVGGTVDNTNNLGGFPMSAFQQKADEPKTHEVLYYLGQTRSGTSHSTVPADLDFVDMEIVSHTVAGLTSLRLAGQPLPAEESFRWLPGSESITVVMADIYGTGVSELYTCVPRHPTNTTPTWALATGVTCSRKTEQPKIGDIIYVNFSPTMFNGNVSLPTDFWHPNWGTMLVRSDDTHYSVVQPGVSTLSAVFVSSEISSEFPRESLETVWSLNATIHTLPADGTGLQGWLNVDANSVTLLAGTMGTRKPTQSEFEAHVHYNNEMHDNGSAFTRAYFPYYDASPSMSGLQYLRFEHVGANERITAANVADWLYKAKPTTTLIFSQNKPSGRNRSLIRVLLFSTTDPVHGVMHSGVNMNKDNYNVFVLTANASLFPYGGIPNLHGRRVTQFRTHVEGYQEASVSRVTGALTVSGGLGVTGDIHADNVYADSDVSLKCDVNALEPEEAMDAILDLRPKRYRWKNGRRSDMDYGFLAQEARQCLAGDVKVDPHTGLHSMNTNKIIPFLVGAVQHLYNNKQKRGQKKQKNPAPLRRGQNKKPVP